jgi:hypothetical protein
MRRNASDVALRTQVARTACSTRRCSLYAPQHLPGLKVEMIVEEELVLVTTDPSLSDVSDPEYVYVDWGEDFAAHHDMSFPRFSDPGLLVGLGPHALDYIVQVGGGLFSDARRAALSRERPLAGGFEGTRIHSPRLCGLFGERRRRRRRYRSRRTPQSRRK